MFCNKPLLTAAILSSAIGSPVGAVSAGELAAGKAKAQSVCQTCHGMDGQATAAMVPNLSGQRKEYIIVQLESFRAGIRQHAQMSIIAKNLTDDDIENVAEWYSNIRISVEQPSL